VHATHFFGVMLYTHIFFSFLFSDKVVRKSADPKRKKRVNRETVTTGTQKNQEPVVGRLKIKKLRKDGGSRGYSSVQAIL